MAVSYGVDGVLVTPLAAPPDSLLYQCLDIVVRDGRMLVWDSCDPTAPGLYELGTADLYPFLIDPSEIDPFESGSVGYLERGGIAIATLGDAEGIPVS
ncbi:MAG: hypothetical protein JJE47_03495 [Acidimicrobiia bacterium]|nr:hypothetical protein [Acidimicrobiia bacterium]